MLFWSNKSRFLKQKQQQKIILYFTNWCYKNKMKTYCMKCRRDTKNVDPKMVRTKININYAIKMSCLKN